MVGDSNILLFEQLQKAVEAGALTGQEYMNQLNMLGVAKYESLKETVIELAPKMTNFRLFPEMPKVQIFDTKHQWVQEVSNGNRPSRGVNESEIPKAVTAEATRRIESIAYIAEMRQVTIPSTLVKTVYGQGVDQTVERSLQKGITNLTKTLNELCVFGNKRVAPKTFNGFIELHSSSLYWQSKDVYQDSSFVIDLRNNGFGGDITTEALDDAVLAVIQDGLGDLNSLQFFFTPSAKTKYTKAINIVRQVENSSAVAKTNPVGLTQNSYVSALGEVPFVTDIFIANRNPPKYSTSLATDTEAPLPPTTPTAVLSPDATTRFADSAGDYYYAVTAINENGESAPLVLTPSILSVLATESVDLGWVDGGGQFPATGYVIYRSEKDVSTSLANTPLYPIFSVSTTEKSAGYDGAAVTLVRDKNRVIANTEDAWLIQWDNLTIEFPHLGDGMQIIEFSNVVGNFFGKSSGLYMMGMPCLYAPKRMVRLMNIRR